jgi:hypothetical protein
VVGDNVVVPPTHTKLAPVIVAVGDGVTETGDVANELQPVAVKVKVKVAEPAATPDTNPAFVTVAIASLLLTHVPPVDGDN